MIDPKKEEEKVDTYYNAFFSCGIAKIDTCFDLFSQNNNTKLINTKHFEILLLLCYARVLYLK